MGIRFPDFPFKVRLPRADRMVRSTATKGTTMASYAIRGQDGTYLVESGSFGSVGGCGRIWSSEVAKAMRFPTRDDAERIGTKIMDCSPTDRFCPWAIVEAK